MDSLTPSESTKVLSLELFATMGFHHMVLRAFLILQNLEEDWTFTLSSKRLHKEGNKLFTKSQCLFFCYEIFGPCFQKKFLEFSLQTYQTNWQKRVSIRDKNTVEQSIYCLQEQRTFQIWTSQSLIESLWPGDATCIRAEIPKLSGTDGLKMHLNALNKVSTLWTRQIY